MKEDKKAILDILKKTTKKSAKFENLVLNLALQKVNSDRFEYDGKAVYTADMSTLIYCLANETTFIIPDGVTTVGRMAFAQHDKLQTVVFPQSVKKIEREAFAECEVLETISIPSTLEDIRGYAFSECDGLKEVTFDGVPCHLGRRAFSGCENLHVLRVPKGTSDFFRKELHISDDPDLLVVEQSADATVGNTTSTEKGQ